MKLKSVLGGAALQRGLRLVSDSECFCLVTSTPILSLWLVGKDTKRPSNRSWTVPRSKVHNVPMTIGELAAKAAVNIQTVRFHERKGILAPPPRSKSGYRCYGENDLETLCFIRRSQDLGFTLQEISQLLPLHRSVAKITSAKRPMPREMRAMAVVARRRLQQVDEKLRLLKTMRSQLLAFVNQLETTAPVKCLAPATQPAHKKQSSCPA